MLSTSHDPEDDAVDADEFALALEALPVAIAVVSERGRPGTLNAAARELLGVPGDITFDRVDFPVRALDGRPLREDERPSELALRTETRQVMRVLYTRPDGRELVLDVDAAPLERGTSGYVAVLHDVTDEHNERALNRQFLQQLFETLPIAIGVFDPETSELLTVNQTYAQLVGLEVADMVGRRPPFPWWATDAHAAAPVVAWAGRSPDEGVVEAVFRHRGGHLIPVEILPFAVGGEDGVPARSVALITSQTDRHEFARQLAQSGKLAALGELAAGVAHEINNPLFAILGLAEFLLNDAEPGTKAHERLLLIQSTGSEIKEIVRALLDFAREPTDVFAAVDVRAVFHDAVELVRRTSAVRGVEIVEHYPDEAPDVLGSANQLKQVVLNLVGNAQQAMPDGGTVTIEVTSDADCVTATVRDDGPGIPAEIMPRIFDPFFTTRRDGGGTGLGLAVSHGIAEMHGGRLLAESVPGSGASFHLRLPVERQP